VTSALLYRAYRAASEDARSANRLVRLRARALFDGALPEKYLREAVAEAERAEARETRLGRAASRRWEAEREVSHG
jgi:hypothetical protein